MLRLFDAVRQFLSTPSGWRATKIPAHLQCPARISIHALRVEGDCRTEAEWWRRSYFYPRPPGGGRRKKRSSFLFALDFYPRPPGGGRQRIYKSFTATTNFYPRPPGGGRHRSTAVVRACRCISIHALRVEGDVITASAFAFVAISIHALRVEGDLETCRSTFKISNFYPRPPGGGRPVVHVTYLLRNRGFLSTPSGWRATLFLRYRIRSFSISIHALRVEGDLPCLRGC